MHLETIHLENSIFRGKGLIFINFWSNFVCFSLNRWFDFGPNLKIQGRAESRVGLYNLEWWDNWTIWISCVTDTRQDREKYPYIHYTLNITFNFLNYAVSFFITQQAVKACMIENNHFCMEKMTKFQEKEFS